MNSLFLTILIFFLFKEVSITKGKKLFSIKYFILDLNLLIYVLLGNLYFAESSFLNKSNGIFFDLCVDSKYVLKIDKANKSIKGRVAIEYQYKSFLCLKFIIEV